MNELLHIAACITCGVFGYIVRWHRDKKIFDKMKIALEELKDSLRKIGYYKD